MGSDLCCVERRSWCCLFPPGGTCGRHDEYLAFPGTLECRANVLTIEYRHWVMASVSIIVPCFNQEPFIAETLESVWCQSYSDWECIIVNDGSTDDSEAVIQGYVRKDPRFRLFTQTNRGVAAARNFGFSRASGEFCVPLDGDDKLHPDFLKRAIECFTTRSDTDLVHCKTKLFGAKNKIWRLPEYSYEKLLWQNMLVNTAMFRRAAFERAVAIRRKWCMVSRIGNSTSGF
ncbi:MAG: glycosyltransferase family A protein [Pararobbsia sp.]